MVHQAILSYRSYSPLHKYVEQILPPPFFFCSISFLLISQFFHSFSFEAAGSCPNREASRLANMCPGETNGFPLCMGNPVLFHMRVECPIPHASIFTLRILTHPDTVSREGKQERTVCGSAIRVMTASYPVGSWCPLTVYYTPETALQHMWYNNFLLCLKINWNLCIFFVYESRTRTILQLLCDFIKQFKRR